MYNIMYPPESCNKVCILLFSVKDEETKAPGGLVISPKWCSYYRGSLGFEPRLSDSRVCNSNRYAAKGESSRMFLCLSYKFASNSKKGNNILISGWSKLILTTPHKINYHKINLTATVSTPHPSAQHTHTSKQPDPHNLSNRNYFLTCLFLLET